MKIKIVFQVISASQLNSNEFYFAQQMPPQGGLFWAGPYTTTNCTTFLTPPSPNLSSPSRSRKKKTPIYIQRQPHIFSKETTQSSKTTSRCIQQRDIPNRQRDIPICSAKRHPNPTKRWPNPAPVHTPPPHNCTHSAPTPIHTQPPHTCTHSPPHTCTHAVPLTPVYMSVPPHTQLCLHCTQRDPSLYLYTQPLLVKAIFLVPAHARSSQRWQQWAWCELNDTEQQQPTPLL